MAKIIGNTTATPNPQPDWLQTDDKKADYIKNKPDLSVYATQGDLESFGDYVHGDLANRVGVLEDNFNIANEDIAGIYTSIGELGTQVAGLETSVADKLDKVTNPAENYDKASMEQYVYAITADGEQKILKATRNAAPLTVASRDGAGRIKVGTPNEDNDAAHKKYVDDVVADVKVDLTGYATEQYVQDEIANVKVDLTGYATEQYVQDEIAKSDRDYTIIKEILDTGGQQFCGIAFNTWYVAELSDNTQEGSFSLRAYSSTYEADGAADDACESYIDIEHGKPFQFPTSGWWYCGGSDVPPEFEALTLDYCWTISENQVMKLYEVVPQYAPFDSVYSKSEVDSSFATKQEVDDAVDRMIITPVQTTGYSETAVMSQKSVSDVFDWISEYVGGTIGIEYKQNNDGGYQVAGNGFNRNPNVVIFSQFKGEDVSAIKEGAFNDCPVLTSIAIPDSVTSIGSGAFSGCDSLTSITIPDSVTSIGESAFYSCDSLPNVTIPDSVTSIGDMAFSSCTSLKDISVDMNNEEYADIDGSLYTKDKSTLICYAVGKQGNSFTIPNTVTSISAGAFMDCSALTNIILPDDLVSIGDEAFCYCDNLVGVKNVDSPIITNIPDSVTEIGSSAFSGCSKLSGVIYLDDVSVGPFAFAGCTSIADIEIRDTVKTIYKKAFDGCTNATVACEATEKPEGWNDDWCGQVKQVIWGVKFN